MSEPDDDDVFLTSAQVRKRYGNMSKMTLARRISDETSDFPKPVPMGGRNYWRFGDLLAYERRCAAGNAAKVHSKEIEDSSRKKRKHDQGETIGGTRPQ